MFITHQTLTSCVLAPRQTKNAVCHRSDPLAGVFVRRCRDGVLGLRRDITLMTAPPGSDGFSFVDLTEALKASAWERGAERQALSPHVFLDAEPLAVQARRCQKAKWHVRRNLGRYLLSAACRAVKHHGFIELLQPLSVWSSRMWLS